MGWIKQVVFAVALLFGGYAMRAQGRNKTMREQVAALQVYIGTVEKGYQLAVDGVHLVRDIKSGEFGLHRVFFGSLRRVDEGVLMSPVLGEVIGYIAVLGDRSRNEAAALRVLTTDMDLSMTDGERLRQIMQIRDALRAKYGEFTRWDAARSWMDVQRKKEKSYLQTLKKMYGIQ